MSELSGPKQSSNVSRVLKLQRLLVPKVGGRVGVPSASSLSNFGLDSCNAINLGVIK